MEDLAERAARILGAKSDGSPVGDLTAALDEVEALRARLAEVEADREAHAAAADEAEAQCQSLSASLHVACDERDRLAVENQRLRDENQRLREGVGRLHKQAVEVLDSVGRMRSTGRKVAPMVLWQRLEPLVAALRGAALRGTGVTDATD